MLNMLIDDINAKLGVSAVYCGTDVIICDNKKQIVYTPHKEAKTKTTADKNIKKSYINKKYGILNQKGDVYK